MFSWLENQEWISFCYCRAVTVSLQKEISYEKTDDLVAHVTNSGETPFIFRSIRRTSDVRLFISTIPCTLSKTGRMFFFFPW
jgi:N-acetylmuramic acid 6-phosphate (MurNAc-6-P) etherase